MVIEVAGASGGSGWSGTSGTGTAGGRTTSTPGGAILWGASDEYNVCRRPASDMDGWMEAVLQDPAAAGTFAGGDDPVLLRLLDYKFRLGECDRRIEPLGVVTNDQRRPDGGGRVYTQYVFRLRVTPRRPVGPDGLDALVRETGVELCPVSTAVGVDPRETFWDHRGRRNLMDILAWEALRGPGCGDAFAEGTARFRRGFRLV